MKRNDKICYFLKWLIKLSICKLRQKYNHKVEVLILCNLEVSLSLDLPRAARGYPLHVHWPLCGIRCEILIYGIFPVYL